MPRRKIVYIEGKIKTKARAIKDRRNTFFLCVFGFLSPGKDLLVMTQTIADKGRTSTKNRMTLERIMRFSFFVHVLPLPFRNPQSEIISSGACT
jgi:hypothetical protein